MFTVYKITNKLENKSYVGVTGKTIEERLSDHWYDRTKNYDKIPLRKALITYGKENFNIEKIKICDTLEEAFKFEKEYITKLNTIKAGYNVATGGRGGDTLTYNLKRKEISEKIKSSKLGDKNHNAKQVDVYFKNDFLKRFGSAGEATRYFKSIGIDIAESSVKRKCSGVIKNNYIKEYKVYWSE